MEIKKQPPETIFAKGRIFELVHLEQEDGRIFEVARRAPGVRMIIADLTTKRLLLTREFRTELSGWDYRLPGGKVFDSLDEYEAHRQSGDDIVAAAECKVRQEVAEEAGLIVNDAKLVTKSTLGATVEWDLFVFEVTDFEKSASGQALEKGEQIEADQWFSYDEAAEMIMQGKMQEGRVALVLLQWLHKQNEGAKS
jgi:ADP-ribose pyrophosphatase